MKKGEEGAGEAMKEVTCGEHEACMWLTMCDPYKSDYVLMCHIAGNAPSIFTISSTKANFYFGARQ